MASEAVAHLCGPCDIEIAIGCHVCRWEAVHTENSIGGRADLGQWRHLHGLAPCHAAISRFDHPGAVRCGEARRAIPEDVQRAIRANDRTRALAVEDIAGDELRGAEGVTAIGRESKVNRRLDVTP